MSQNPNAPSEIPSSLIEQIGGLPKEKQAAIRLLIQNIDLFEKMMENDSEFDHILQKYAEKGQPEKEIDYLFQALFLYRQEKRLREKKEKKENEASQEK